MALIGLFKLPSSEGKIDMLEFSTQIDMLEFSIQTGVRGDEVTKGREATALLPGEPSCTHKKADVHKTVYFGIIIHSKSWTKMLRFRAVILRFSRTSRL